MPGGESYAQQVRCPRPRPPPSRPIRCFHPHTRTAPCVHPASTNTRRGAGGTPRVGGHPRRAPRLSVTAWPAAAAAQLAPEPNVTACSSSPAGLLCLCAFWRVAGVPGFEYECIPCAYSSDIQLRIQGGGGSPNAAQPESNGGRYDRTFGGLDAGKERERERESRGGWLDARPAAGTNRRLANGENRGEREVQIMADITSAPHAGLEHEPRTSNWSAPSAIEARMLGIADGGSVGGTPSKRRSRGSGGGQRSSPVSDDDGDPLRLPRSGALTSRLPQEIIDLVLKLSRSRGRAQAVASERVRQLIHNKAVSGMIAKESWVLDIMAQVRDLKY
jgi:hypothetical protein